MPTGNGKSETWGVDLSANKSNNDFTWVFRTWNSLGSVPMAAAGHLFRCAQSGYIVSYVSEPGFDVSIFGEMGTLNSSNPRAADVGTCWLGQNQQAGIMRVGAMVRNLISTGATD